MAALNPHFVAQRRPTIFDGVGNRTRPYHTIIRGRGKAPYHINRRWIRFHARFYTQNGGYDAYYTIGRYDTKSKNNHKNKDDQLTTPKLEHEFSNELMGFNTSNQGNNSQSTMNIYLFGFRDWEQILQVNDYCAITVEECYPDDKNWIKQANSDPNVKKDSQGNPTGIEQRTLMTGLISNIHISEDPNGQGRTYTITCNGMEKILNNITLGLPPKAQIAGTNLLFDINGDSNPANETFPFGNGGPTKKTKQPTGGGAYGLSGAPGQVAKFWSSHGFNKAQVAGTLGNLQQESGINPSERGGGLYQDWEDPSMADKSVAAQSEHLMKQFPGRIPKYKKDSSGCGPSKCAYYWCEDVEIPDGGEARISSREEYAENWYHKMK